MNFHNFIADIVSMVISVIGLYSFVLIIHLILKAQRGYPYYSKRRVVRLFMYLFFIMAVIDTFLIIDHFYDIGTIIMTILFVIRGILTIVTIIYYYMDIPKFYEKEISIKKHKEILAKVIAEFESTNLSPKVKEDFIKKLQLQINDGS